MNDEQKTAEGGVTQRVEDFLGVQPESTERQVEHIYGLDVSDGNGGIRHDVDSLTLEEWDRRQTRQAAAARYLFEINLDTLDKESAAGMFTAVTDAIFRMPDQDGSIVFGSRKSEDPKKNLEMLREVLTGNWKLLQSEESQRFEAMSEDEQVKYVDEKESFQPFAEEDHWWNKVSSWLKGERGPGVPQLVKAAAKSIGSGTLIAGSAGTEMLEAGVEMKMDPEKEKRDKIANYRRKLNKDQPLFAILNRGGMLSDRGRDTLAKAVVEGRLDVDAVAGLSETEQPIVMQAFSEARGEQTHGRILGIDTEFNTGTVGDRAQMMIYGFQQALINLAVDTVETGAAMRNWVDLKRVKDDQERRELDDALRLVSQVENANKQDLPEGGFWGQAMQGLAENAHWAIPYLIAGKAGKAAKVAREAAKFDREMKAINEAAMGVSAATGIDYEYIACRMLASEGKLVDQLNIIKRFQLAAQAGTFGGLTAESYAAMANSARAMTLATFTNEYIQNADAAGISREESVPMALIVGFFNDRIEQFAIPGLEESMALNKMKATAFREVGNAFRKGKLLPWISKRLAADWAAGAKIGVEEGFVEEPLQQLVIEWGKRLNQIAEDGDEWSNWGRFKDYLLNSCAEDLQTYIDTSVDMIPMSAGYFVNEGPSERRRAWRANQYGKLGNAMRESDNRYVRKLGNLLFGGDTYVEPLSLADIKARYDNLTARIAQDKAKEDSTKRTSNEILTEALRLASDGTIEKPAEALHESTGLDYKLCEAITQYAEDVTILEEFDPEVHGFAAPTQLPTLDKGEFAGYNIDPKSYKLSEDGRTANVDFNVGGVKVAVQLEIGDTEITLDELRARVNDKADGSMSDFGASYEANHGKDSWKNLSRAGKLKAAAVATPGVTLPNMVRGADGKLSRRDVALPYDVLIRLSNGNVHTALAEAQREMGITDEEMAAASDETVNTAANRAQEHHEIFHALYNTVMAFATPKEKEAIRENIRIAKGWKTEDMAAMSDADIEEALAYDFQKYGASGFNLNTVEGPFQRFQVSLGAFLRKLKIGSRKDASKYGLDNFYGHVMSGELGSGNLGIERMAAPQAAAPASQTKGAGAVSTGTIPVNEAQVQKTAQAINAMEQQQPEAPKEPETPKRPEAPIQPQKPVTPVNNGFRPAFEGDERTKGKLGIPKTEGKVVGHWEVKAAESLQSSFGAGGDNQFQHRDKSNLTEIVNEHNINHLNYDLAGRPPSNGMINSTGIVVHKNLKAVNGNGRVLLIQTAYARNTAADYRAKTIAEAEYRGLTIPAEAMEHPVLVFVIDGIEGNDKLTLQDLARLTNKDDKSGKSPYTVAREDADAIRDLVGGIATKPDGSIDFKKSQQTLAQIAAKFDMQAGFFREGSDQLTAQGAERLSRAVLALIMGGQDANSDTLRAIFEEAGFDEKGNGLDMAAEIKGLMNRALELYRLMQAKPTYNISKSIAGGLAKFIEWRRRDNRERDRVGADPEDWRGKGFTWTDFDSERDMFTPRNEVDYMIGSALARARGIRYRKQMGQQFRGSMSDTSVEASTRYVMKYLSAFIERAMNANTETEDMFRPEPPTAEELMALGEQAVTDENIARMRYSVPEMERHPEVLHQVIRTTAVLNSDYVNGVRYAVPEKDLKDDDLARRMQGSDEVDALDAESVLAKRHFGTDVNDRTGLWHWVYTKMWTTVASGRIPVQAAYEVASVAWNHCMSAVRRGVFNQDLSSLKTYLLNYGEYEVRNFFAKDRAPWNADRSWRYVQLEEKREEGDDRPGIIENYAAPATGDRSESKRDAREMINMILSHFDARTQNVVELRLAGFDFEAIGNQLDMTTYAARDVFAHFMERARGMAEKGLTPASGAQTASDDTAQGVSAAVSIALDNPGRVSEISVANDEVGDLQRRAANLHNQGLRDFEVAQRLGVGIERARQLMGDARSVDARQEKGRQRAQIPISLLTNTPMPEDLAYTDGERQVVQLFNKGLNRKEIAAKLGISKRALEGRMSVARRLAEAAGWKQSTELNGIVPENQVAVARLYNEGLNRHEIAEKLGITLVNADGLLAKAKRAARKRGWDDKEIVTLSDRLRPREREAAELFNSGMKVSEIAKKMGIGSTAVSSLLSNARARATEDAELSPRYAVGETVRDWLDNKHVALKLIPGHDLLAAAQQVADVKAKHHSFKHYNRMFTRFEELARGAMIGPRLKGWMHDLSLDQNGTEALPDYEWTDYTGFYTYENVRNLVNVHISDWFAGKDVSVSELVGMPMEASGAAYNAWKKRMEEVDVRTVKHHLEEGTEGTPDHRNILYLAAQGFYPGLSDEDMDKAARMLVSESEDKVDALVELLNTNSVGTESIQALPGPLYRLNEAVAQAVAARTAKPVCSSPRTALVGFATEANDTAVYAVRQLINKGRRATFVGALAYQHHKGATFMAEDLVSTKNGVVLQEGATSRSAHDLIDRLARAYRMTVDQLRDLDAWDDILELVHRIPRRDMAHWTGEQLAETMAYFRNFEEALQDMEGWRDSRNLFAARTTPGAFRHFTVAQLFKGAKDGAAITDSISWSDLAKGEKIPQLSMNGLVEQTPLELLLDDAEGAVRYRVGTLAFNTYIDRLAGPVMDVAEKIADAVKDRGNVTLVVPVNGRGDTLKKRIANDVRHILMNSLDHAMVSLNCVYVGEKDGRIQASVDPNTVFFNPSTVILDLTMDDGSTLAAVADAVAAYHNPTADKGKYHRVNPLRIVPAVLAPRGDVQLVAKKNSPEALTFRQKYGTILTQNRNLGYDQDYLTRNELRRIAGRLAQLAGESPDAGGAESGRGDGRGVRPHDGRAQGAALTPAGRQKLAGVAYPDAKADILDPRYSVAERAAQTLAKRRPDLDEAERARLVTEILKFPENKLRVAALHWVVKGAILLPEDAYKVEAAVKLANNKRVDPLSFDRPMEIINKFTSGVVDGVKANPEDYPELLTDRTVLPNGLVVYNVQDGATNDDGSTEGQMLIRHILTSHKGKGFNCWCLVRDDGHDGVSKDAVGYWSDTYNSLPKRVAFLNGTIHAFMATDSEGAYQEGSVEERLSARQLLKLYKDYAADEGYDDLDAYIEQGEVDPRDEYSLFRWIDNYHSDLADRIKEQYGITDIEEQWWDMDDRAHEGIPVDMALTAENLGTDTDDEFGRMGTFEVKTDGTVEGPVGHLWRGDMKNGVYEEWMDARPESLLSREELKDEKNVGKKIVYEGWTDGHIVEIHNFRDGVDSFVTYNRLGYVSRLDINRSLDAENYLEEISIRFDEDSGEMKVARFESENYHETIDLGSWGGGQYRLERKLSPTATSYEAEDYVKIDGDRDDRRMLVIKENPTRRFVFNDGTTFVFVDRSNSGVPQHLRVARGDKQLVVELADSDNLVPTRYRETPKDAYYSDTSVPWTDAGGKTLEEIRDLFRDRYGDWIEADRRRLERVRNRVEACSFNARDLHMDEPKIPPRPGLTDEDIPDVKAPTEISKQLFLLGQQKFADADYPDASGEILAPRFAVGEKRRAEYERLLRKYRSDFSEAQIGQTLGELDKYNNPKKEKVTLNWLIKGAVILPEDEYKVDQAIEIADRHHLDLIHERSPMEVIEKFPLPRKGGERNPDKLKCLVNKTEWGNGITVYDIVDGDQDPTTGAYEAQEELRGLMNAQLGVKTSPWCLLRGDENGKLDTHAPYYWNNYDAIPKQVAFKDGRIVAFHASDTPVEKWWDMQDEASPNVRTVGRIPWDSLGSSAHLEYTKNGQPTVDNSIKWRGSKTNGRYEEWDEDGHYTLREVNRKGELAGPRVVWDYYGAPMSAEYPVASGHRINLNWRPSGSIIQYTVIDPSIDDYVFCAEFTRLGYLDHITIKNGRSNEDGTTKETFRFRSDRALSEYDRATGIYHDVHIDFDGVGGVVRSSLGDRAGALENEVKKALAKAGELLARWDSQDFNRPELPADPELSDEEIMKRLGAMGRQKQAGVTYPDASLEILSPRFAVGERRRRDYDTLLAKKRHDLSDEQRAKVLAELDKYDNPKKEKLALHWVIRGMVRLPEDEYKVDAAIAVAEAKKVDPFQYESPAKLLASFPTYTPKEAPIDPATVPAFSNPDHRGSGVVVYDVDEKTGQEWVRKVINTHWGKDKSPWCLARGDENGNLLDDAKYYWEHYTSLPKKIAFVNGRLACFMATDEERDLDQWEFEDDIREEYEEAYAEDPRLHLNFYDWMFEHHRDILEERRTELIREQWWDRDDQSHPGVPVEADVPNDELHRKCDVLVLEDGPDFYAMDNIHLGNQKNGVYAKWYGRSEIESAAEYKGGKKTGYEVYYGRNNRVERIRWAEDDKDGNKIIHYLSFNMFGQPAKVGSYKDTPGGMRPVGVVLDLRNGRIRDYEEHDEEGKTRLHYQLDVNGKVVFFQRGRGVGENAERFAFEEYGDKMRDVAFKRPDGKILRYYRQGSLANNGTDILTFELTDLDTGIKEELVWRAYEATYTKTLDGKEVEKHIGASAKATDALAKIPSFAHFRDDVHKFVDDASAYALEHVAIQDRNRPDWSIPVLPKDGQFTHEMLEFALPQPNPEVRIDSDDAETELPPRYAVGDRRFTGRDFEGMNPEVQNLTSHNHLVGHDDPVVHNRYETFKAVIGTDPDRALVMARDYAESFVPGIRYLGQYLKGKYFADMDAALVTVRHFMQEMMQRRGFTAIQGVTDLGRNTVYVPIVSEVNTNMLPEALARVMVERFGGSVDTQMRKTSDHKSSHAGMRERLATDTEWHNLPSARPGDSIVLVDDVWTTGSTVRGAMDWLKANNLMPRAVLAMAVARAGKHVFPTEEEKATLVKKAKVGSWEEAKSIAGLDLDKLTGSEVVAYNRGTQYRGRGGLAEWFAAAQPMRLPLFEQRYAVGTQVPHPTPAQLMPRLNRMTDDELLVAALAAGMVINPQKAEKRAKTRTGFGFYKQNKAKVEEMVRRAHPELADNYGEISRRAALASISAQYMARDFRRQLDQGATEAEILERLPKKLHEGFTRMIEGKAQAGGRIMALGTKAKQMLDRKWENALAEMVNSQTGLESDLFEQWAGIDFAETLHRVLSNEKVDRVADRANTQHSDAPEAGRGAIGTEDPEKKLKDAVPSLKDPGVFADTLLDYMWKYWREQKKVSDKATPWADPVSLQFARKTAANVYRKLVRALDYSNARDVANREIAKFSNAATWRSLRGQMQFAGEIIQARQIREDKEKLLKDLQALLERQYGAVGRFKVDREELRRKVSAELELRARYMKHAMWLSRDVAAAEAENLMDELQEVIGNYEKAERDYHNSRDFMEITRKINILREFGGLKDKTLGEIQDAIEYWQNAADEAHAKIVEEMQEREIRTVVAAEALARAVANPKLKNRAEGGLKADINNYIAGHMGFTSLLQDMIRYSEGDVRRQAEVLIDYISREIQKAGDQARAEERQQTDAFVRAVERIYAMPFRKAMARLTDEAPEFAPFMNTRGGKAVKPTRGRAMQLFVELMQGLRMGDNYYDNVIEHGRKEQFAQMMPLLSEADKNLIAWLGQWYEQNRGGLSEVSEALFGMGVYSETPNYYPAKMLREKEGLETVQGVNWRIFPRALTPRVRNLRDFDTSVDIVGLWMERMQEAAQWKAHAKLGLELRGIFGRGVLREAVAANHGGRVEKMMQEFITDILQGHADSEATASGVEKAADWMRGWTALAALGGNIGVTMKQVTSIPAFGFEIGLVDTARHIVTAFTPAGWEAMNRIWNSEQRKTRWQIGSSEAVENALSGRDASYFKKAIQATMITNKLGDITPSLIVGQGIYRDLLERGMSPDDAMAQTWMIIERTQQSSRIENQPKLQRRMKMGKLLYQFLSTQQQYLQYEMRSIRELAARRNIPAVKKLVNTLVINHLLLTSFYYWMGELYRRLLGSEPPEDELKQWMTSCLLGPYAALFVLGFTAKATLDRLVFGKRWTNMDMLPMEGFIKRTLIGDPADLMEAVFDQDKSWEDVLEEGLQWTSDLNAIARDVRKIHQNYISDESPKKKGRKAAPKALK